MTFSRKATATFTLLVLVTAVAVELVRATGPMFDRAFTAGIVVVALTALGTYVAPGLVAALLVRGRPVTGRTVVQGVALLAVARAAVQVLDGVARYWVTLAAAALAIGVLVVVLVRSVRVLGAATAALAVTTGGALATGVSLVLGTWDAIWRSGASGWAPTALTLVAAAACAWAVRADDAADTPGARPARVWVLGPYLGVTLMVVLNPAYLASQLGLSLTVAASALAAGVVLAAALTLWSLPRQSALLPAALRAVVLVAAAALVLFPITAEGEDAGTLLAVGLGVVVALLVAVSTTSLATAWDAPAKDRGPRSAGVTLAGTASAVGLGVILPLLVYQVDYDVPLGFPNAFVILAAVVVVALGGLRRRTPPTDVDAAAPRADVRAAWLPAVPALAVTAALVLVGAAVNRVQVEETVRVAGGQPDAPLTLLDWNLHYGVTQEPGLDLGRMADVINTSGAQVVALQEISRGWIMGGGADMATYLARATGMRVVSAPAADRQFVNVLLVSPSVGEPQHVVRTRLPYGDGPQQRSAITATVRNAAGTPFVVTSAHLQHREENTPTRLQQLDVLMSADVASSPAAVIAGDLNSEPGWPEIAYVEAAGYVSGQDTAGDPGRRTFPAHAPEVRIDWVFGRGVTFSDVRVLPDGGSDHLPIVATVHPVVD
ncbi:endonuclease [Sanguibacter hominis ATCC BAA-789]|uniref:Endonuclease n=1 Tax=Sanguibacter hominis ATCC BAA-789 TaxID=1312740 RepID=A0A9X5IPV2_9MICO|nr:endonuclease/exonuclease/phosphatase family protein [Sanguibacter hominis]NKX91970.1 endonuclease [Sanguibacter hominis ATCC BAA-789]